MRNSFKLRNWEIFFFFFFFIIGIMWEDTLDSKLLNYILLYF
jgi:hypothetical protein